MLTVLIGIPPFMRLPMQILHNLYAFLPVFKNIYLLHAELLICGAVMSGIFAIGFNKIFNRKPCVQVDNTKI